MLLSKYEVNWKGFGNAMTNMILKNFQLDRFHYLGRREKNFSPELDAEKYRDTVLARNRFGRYISYITIILLRLMVYRVIIGVG